MKSEVLLSEFVRHRESLFAYVLALTADRHIAEDVLQEIGVAILGEANRGTEPENVLLWLRGLARHRTADHYRRLAVRERRETQFERFADVVDQAFAEHCEPAEKQERRLEFLQECLEELTDRVRGMVDSRYRLQRSIEAISLEIGWTAGSVKVALVRARRSLAECIGRKSRREEVLR
jgi:RNA polymerase sigma-70 factor (ECF subfamily)